MSDLICKECRSYGKSSVVYCTPGKVALVGSLEFWDHGKYHFHNPNFTTNHFRCGNGHSWIEKQLQKCPACP